jgi:tryptophanyl-tRNA synthetase
MKKRILTWLKPTGEHLHIGNYFGAIAPMLKAQASWTYDVMLMLANLHSLTALHNAEKIHTYSMNVLKMYLACGIDPTKTIIFNQADIHAHAECARILGCITNMGTMERMHAYKDAVAKGKANELSVWVFSYPILMAGDILLYDIGEVPVGKDQKQHVEYARDIAEKFNKHFGDTFTLPQPIIDEAVATVPGIDGRKMSKSYNNYIWMLDDEKTVMKKIKIIPTDTKGVDESKDPDTCNVYKILKLFLTEDENFVLRKKYTDGGMGYKEVKDMLFEKVMWFLTPIQEKYNTITDDEIRHIVKEWTAKAREQASVKVALMKERVGFSL